MADRNAVSGAAVTISFSSTFFAQILNVDISDISREPIDTTYGTVTNGYMTFIPSDLIDPGTASVEVNFDADKLASIPIGSTVETVTVTFPTPTGAASGGSFACSGFLTGANISSPIDDRITATFDLKFTGQPTWTATTS